MQDTDQVASLSKLIQKEVRRAMKAKKSEAIDKILTQFKGLRFIANVRNNGKRHQLSTIIDGDGQLQSSE